MKKIHLLILIAAAALLLAIYLALRSGEGPSTTLPPTTDVLGGTMDTAAVRAIRLSTGDAAGETVTLRKAGDDWVVETEDATAPADPNWIDQLLESLGELDQGGEVRGTTEAVHDDLGVDEESGVHLVLMGEGGDVLHDLVIGRPNRDWTGTFVRRADQTETVLVATTLRQKLRLRGSTEEPTVEPEAWWKLRLHDADPADITRLEIEGPEAEDRVLVREEPETEEAEPTWSVAEGESLENPEQLVRSFATARATRVAPSSAPTGLGEDAEPAAVIRAETDGGETLVLELGAEVADMEGARYVRRAGEEVAYVLPAYAVNNLLAPEQG